MLLAAAASFVTPLNAQTEAPTIKVMSYNVLIGGIGRKQPLSQTAKVIQEAQADVVGLQEIQTKHAPKNKEKLATLLDWDCDENSDIMTRYEIVERIKGANSRYKGGIKVKLPSGKEAYIFNLHLVAAPYQPYQLLNIKYGRFPFIKTEAEAIRWAKKTRGSNLSALLEQIRSLPDQEAPVFVVGDFNEPSHLDWTEAAAKAGNHPIKVKYPTSLAMAKAGFSDAFRSVYPDEMAKPGFTWSPMYKVNHPKTHHDRIDFVYFKGNGLKVTAVQIVGENKKNADIVVAPYPSDHRAVVATFTLGLPLTDQQKQ